MPGEALDKVKKALGMDAETLKKPEIDELEAALEQVDNLDVRELLRARIVKRTAELKAETRRIEAQGDPRGDGSGSSVKLEVKAPPGGATVEKWTVINGKPVKDPEGEYDTFLQAYRVAELEVGKKGGDSLLDTIKALGDLGVFGNGNKGGNDINQTMATRYLDMIERNLPKAGATDTSEVKTLRLEITGIRQELIKASDPIELAKRFKAMTDTMRDAGLITEPGSTGESIESLKEKNRHEEQMVVAKAEAESKISNAKTLAELPKRIGEGIASYRKMESGEEESGAVGNREEQLPPGFKTMKCDCGHIIQIPPEAGETITCGKCQAIYKKKKPEDPGAGAAVPVPK